MRIVKNPRKLETILAELNIRELFDTRELDFQLCCFEKGEFLSAPHIRQRYLLFLAEGRVQIYGVGSDARMIPVNLVKRGTMIGDVEFATERNSNLYSEAMEEVLCAALPLINCREALDRDIRFLHYLMGSLAEKVYLCSGQEAIAVSVEEKLLAYLTDRCENGELKGVGDAALHLGCSRRQLQRVLQALCDEGTLVKTGRGCYALNRHL